jgi:hypothetical protein
MKQKINFISEKLEETLDAFEKTGLILDENQEIDFLAKFDLISSKELIKNINIWYETLQEIEEKFIELTDEIDTRLS